MKKRKLKQVKKKNPKMFFCKFDDSYTEFKKGKCVICGWKLNEK